ncbi:hypothetical protein PAAL66ix_27143 [Paenibacillus alvei A6-6i-x]|nr:hypothetical protein PAAL66ix_27143 [Paenibacillus alvei A6-6i-x]
MSSLLELSGMARLIENSMGLFEMSLMRKGHTPRLANSRIISRHRLKIVLSVTIWEIHAIHRGDIG